MSVIFPSCMECVNILDKNKDDQFCCKAFPKGIPGELFWCKTGLESIKECFGGVGFEAASDKKYRVKPKTLKRRCGIICVDNRVGGIV